MPRSRRPAFPVHPHARGEQCEPIRITWQCHGSSPRSWGTAASDEHLLQHVRFIPTLVGNRHAGPCRRASWPVHPHARGEQDPGCVVRCLEGGSSPRSWGTAGRQHRSRHLRRFIPTLAGNSEVIPVITMGGAVHPHARGEQLVELDNVIAKRGSSPRSWGTGVAGHGVFHQRRFIPTLVGNRFIPFIRFISTAVHPHARGEQGSTSVVKHWQNGSSPRSWGTGAGCAIPLG